MRKRASLKARFNSVSDGKKIKIKIKNHEYDFKQQGDKGYVLRVKVRKTTLFLL